MNLLNALIIDTISAFSRFIGRFAGRAATALGCIGCNRSALSQHDGGPKFLLAHRAELLLYCWPTLRILVERTYSTLALFLG